MENNEKELSVLAWDNTRKMINYILNETEYSIIDKIFDVQRELNNYYILYIREKEKD